MLHRLETLKEYKLDSLDGEMGEVLDFYFDDQHWTIRYLVADTGNWLSGRQVLISPHSLVAAIKEDKHIAVDLARKQIEDSPSLASDKPVSRQFEMDYYGYFGWTPYWAGPFAWGQYPTPMQVGHAEPKSNEEKEDWDSHLRSMGEVTGYWIQAADGEIGHVEDFVIDDETWTIRYLIVDTRNWWPGKKVLVSPRWIDKVSWNESKVFINLPREAVRKSPEYSEESLITRDYETDLHRHYQIEGYWGEGARKGIPAEQR
jgi:hypothetical protein